MGKHDQEHAQVEPLDHDEEHDDDGEGEAQGLLSEAHIAHAEAGTKKHKKHKKAKKKIEKHDKGSGGEGEFIGDKGVRVFNYGMVSHSPGLTISTGTFRFRAARAAPARDPALLGEMTRPM